MNIEEFRNNVKVIGLDLDGTLLNDSKLIDSDTINYLNNFLEEKKYVIFASGRKYMQIRPYIKQFSAMAQKNIFVVSSGGQYIYNSNGEKIWSSENFNRAIVKKICHLLLGDKLNKKCTIVTETKDFIVINKMGMGGVLRNLYYLVKGIENYKNISIDGVEKINLEIEKIIVHTRDVESVDSCLKNMNNIHATLIEQKQVDIRMKTMNKSNAILYLLNILHFNKNNIVVFGDDENDIDVFETFPLSVAMLNATKKVKDRAKYITESNQNNGVLTFLLNYDRGIF